MNPNEFKSNMRIYMKANRIGTAKYVWQYYKKTPHHKRKIANGHLVSFMFGSTFEARRCAKDEYQIRWTSPMHGSKIYEGALVVDELEGEMTVVFWNNSLYAVLARYLKVFNPQTGAYDLPESKWLSTPEDK